MLPTECEEPLRELEAKRRRLDVAIQSILPPDDDDDGNLVKNGSCPSGLDELVEGAWENDVIWDADEWMKNHSILPKDDDDDDGGNFFKDDSCSSGLDELEEDAWENEVIWDADDELKKKEQLEQEAREAEEINEPQQTGCEEPAKDQVCSKGPWNENISNDEFYQSKETPQVEVYHCRHSKLVKDLSPPFITTHLNEDQLRNFHRPKLTAFPSSPAQPDPDRHYIKSLNKRIRLKAKERADLIKQGNCILFDQPIDLTARDGTIILVENSEEHPPLLSQVGMCSQIINFFRKDSRSLKDQYEEPVMPHDFGETSFISNSSSSFPFLGTLENGEVLSAIGNNMYHSPIYWHGRNETDFLVIRSKQVGYLIRDLDGQFVAGQQCPLIEIPKPNSAQVKNFLKEFLQVFVYRQYRTFLPPDSRDVPTGGIIPKVRMDVITQHFPTLTENSIKAILKKSSELKRIGSVTWMVMRSGFLLPMESELTEKVTPEQVCAYYSLLAAEQRLKDAGLHSLLALPERGQDEMEGKKGKKSLSLVENAAPESSKTHQKKQQQPSQSAFEEEMLCAPWNTTSAFIAAKKGKCLLQVLGPTDPTGCNEGYAYVRVAKRGPGALGPGESQNGLPRKYPPKTGGTDADLRKLSSKTAQNWLRRVGVPDHEIQKLSRWEIIDLVRTLSTEKVMRGETIDKGITKFCRWKSLHSAAMNQGRFKEACQRQFELQNRILSSKEELSSDGSASDDEDGNDVGTSKRCGATRKDIELMGKNIERMLFDDADMERMKHEEEELERLELQKIMLGGIMAKDADIARRKAALEHDKELAQKSEEKNEDILTDLMKNPGKVLKITRTFGTDGGSYNRTEIVRNPVVIAAYIRINSSKSEEFIRQFLDKADRKEKKEKKQMDRLLLGKLQDRATIGERKVEKLQQKRKLEMEDEYFPNKGAKKVAEKALKRRSRKCGACKMPGHMRTSKDCPLYNVEKIEEMLKKREAKKEKKKVNLVATNTTLQPQPQSVPALDKVLPSSDNSDSSSDTDTDSGSTSDDEGDFSSGSEDSDEESKSQESTTSNASSQEEESFVRTDGLKMTVKRKGLQEFIDIAEQEEKEHEVARILATMANTPAEIPIPRRRISQAERENADYLNDRRYRTTAADRRTPKN